MQRKNLDSLRWRSLLRLPLIATIASCVVVSTAGGVVPATAAGLQMDAPDTVVSQAEGAPNASESEPEPVIDYENSTVTATQGVAWAGSDWPHIVTIVLKDTKGEPILGAAQDIMMCGTTAATEVGEPFAQGTYKAKIYSDHAGTVPCLSTVAGLPIGKTLDLEFVWNPNTLISTKESTISITSGTRGIGFDNYHVVTVQLRNYQGQPLAEVNAAAESWFPSVSGTTVRNTQPVSTGNPGEYTFKVASPNEAAVATVTIGLSGGRTFESSVTAEFVASQ